MNKIPLVFPLSLIIIIGFTFLTGVYTISEKAIFDGNSASLMSTGVEENNYQWFEKGAIWVCPLH